MPDERRVARRGANRPCSAWPNSWNSVSVSSKVSSVGSPAAGFGTLRLLTTTGRVPSSVGLRDERAHPRAAALRVARVQVEQVEADRGAVVLGDLEHARVGVVADEVGALGDRDAVEQGRRAEHAVDEHPLDLEVGAHRVQVDVVKLGAHLLGEVRPVGCRDRASPVTRGARREGDRLSPRVRAGGRGEPAEQLRRRLRGSRPSSRR